MESDKVNSEGNFDLPPLFDITASPPLNAFEWVTRFIYGAVFLKRKLLILCSFGVKCIELCS